MNKYYVAILIIILVLAGGGLIYYAINGSNTSGNATTTPEVAQSNNNINTQTPPKATTPLVVTKSTTFTTDTTAIVNGTINPKGAFTSYWYEYGVTSSLGTKTSNQTMGSGFVSIQAPGYIVNLTKNTTYYFRLVAENQYGRVSGNQYTLQTTEGNPPPVGSAPTTKTVSASNVSRTTANINGEVTPNKASTQYWFEYGKTLQLGNTSAFSSVGDGSAMIPVSISLSDLQPLTTYYFRLNAQNQFGTINGSILNLKTVGPATPSAPSVVSQNATGMATSGATLHGTINPNGAETKYWFEYSKNILLAATSTNTTSQMTLGASGDITSVKADITNLNSKTLYYFRLVGQNSQGVVRGDKLTFKTQ